MGGEILAILEEEKRKFFGFLDSILKQNSTETILEDTKKEGELKKEGGDRDMADEKKLEDMERRLQELSDAFTKDKKALEDSHKDAIAEVEKKLTESHAKETEAINKKLEDAEKKLSEKEVDLKKEKVTKICDDLVSKGFWPAVVEKAKKVMLEDSAGKFASIKLDEKEMSLTEVLVDILEAIPTEVRVNLEEMAHMEKNTDPNKKYLSDKEVEQYAKDNKMTYQEACSVLAKDGKIDS